MFKFYVIFAGHVMITDFARATKCRQKSKPHDYKQTTKNEGPFEACVSTRKQFEDFRWKKEQQQSSQSFVNTQWNTWPLNATIEKGPGNRAEINWRKSEKSFQIKTVGTLKTGTQKSSPKMFNFYIISVSRDMIIDHWRWQATNYRQKIEAPWLPTECSINEGPCENMCFNCKTVWRFQTRKRTETKFWTFQKTAVGHQNLRDINWKSPL